MLFENRYQYIGMSWVMQVMLWDMIEGNESKLSNKPLHMKLETTSIEK